MTVLKYWDHFLIIAQTSYKVEMVDRKYFIVDQMEIKRHPFPLTLPNFGMFSMQINPKIFLIYGLTKSSWLLRLILSNSCKEVTPFGNTL